jgi:hypothetical protein
MRTVPLGPFLVLGSATTLAAGTFTGAAP